MKHILSAFLLFSFSEVDCYGEVVLIMRGHANCAVTQPDSSVVHHIAFCTEGSGSKWICSNLNSADAVLLSAYATGKIVHASMSDGDM